MFSPPNGFIVAAAATCCCDNVRNSLNLLQNTQRRSEKSSSHRDLSAIHRASGHLLVSRSEMKTIKYECAPNDPAGAFTGINRLSVYFAQIENAPRFSARTFCDWPGHLARITLYGRVIIAHVLVSFLECDTLSLSSCFRGVACVINAPAQRNKCAPHDDMRFGCFSLHKATPVILPNTASHIVG